MNQVVKVPVPIYAGVMSIRKPNCNATTTVQTEMLVPHSPVSGAVKETFRFRASLSQWRAFHAVVACGGFAGAAEYLHVTQPAISYSITKLEQQFGIRLLKLSGRKAHITNAGQVLLERSHELLRMAADLESMACNLRSNGEPSAPEPGGFVEAART
jgi:hypothetical protein